MKIDRLIGIITLLLNQDKVTAPQLAERFEVSRRTIQRDIEDICKAGIPLITIQGHGGGISIAEGYKLDKTILTQEELHNILAGLKGLDSISKTSLTAPLLDKLTVKGGPAVSSGVFWIDLASHYQKELTAKIEAVKQSILEHTIISFEYYYSKGEAVRTIEPYCLIFRWSSWYVFGYCTEKKAYRLFKLNRLWNLTVTNQVFIPRRIPKEEFHFDDYYSSHKIHLKAVFAKSEIHRLIDEYGLNSYSAAKSGELLFEWDFASYEYMRQWVFSFGDKVRIVEPEQLISDRIKQAENILKNFLQT